MRIFHVIRREPGTVRIASRHAGTPGTPGAPGAAGAAGAPGLNAFEVAVANGFEGTEVEWLESLKGEAGAAGAAGAPGLNAFEVAVANGFEGTEVEWLESLKGEAGEPGEGGGVVMIRRFEMASATGPAYFGKAPAGSAEKDEVWRIRRINYDAAGTQTSYGDTEDVSWSGRAGHDYPNDSGERCSLEIHWTDNSELEDGFRVEISTDGENYTTAGTTGPLEGIGGEGSFEVEGLEFNTAYWFQVFATRTGYPDSEALGPVQIYTPPEFGPTNLVAEATGQGEITLTWDDSAEAPTNGGIEIIRLDEPESGYVVAHGVGTLIVEGLDENTLYEFQARNYNTNGEYRSYSPASNTASATTPVENIPPLLVSATIQADGETLVLVFDEEVQIGEDGYAGFTLDSNGGAVTVVGGAVVDGDVVLELSRVVTMNESVTLDFVQPGDGVQDLVGNALASFEDEAVENESGYFAEDWPTASIPAGWSIHETGTAVIDTPPATPPNGGEYVLRINNTADSNSGGAKFSLPTPMAEYSAYFQARLQTRSGWNRLQQYLTGGSSDRIGLYHNAGDPQWRNGNINTDGGTWSDWGQNTWRHVWIDQFDGEHKVYMSTDGIKPALPIFTAGTVSDPITAISLNLNVSTNLWIARIRISPVVLGSNPT